jgi:hypothetical protein
LAVAGISRPRSRAFTLRWTTPSRDADLTRWLVTHLIERRDDYLAEADQRRVARAQRVRGSPISRACWSSIRCRKRSRRKRRSETTRTTSYTNDRALDLWHRLLLLEPGELRRAAPIYFAYHPWIEPVSQMALAPIVAGTFMMGSPETESERATDEGPRHRVTLSHDFWMGIHPVTQEQYQTVMGKNPSRFRGEKRPVENVSWEDAVEFCERLTEQAAVAELLPRATCSGCRPKRNGSTAAEPELRPRRPSATG